MTHRKVQIICFAWDNWGPFWKTTQQLMHYLAKKEEVQKILFVNRDLYLVELIGSLRKELSSLERAKIWRDGISQKVRNPEEKVLVYTPFHYPPFCRREGFFQKVDSRIVLRKLRHLCKVGAESDLILFINRVIPAAVIDFFRDAKVRCFYWTDDWSSFPAQTKRISDIMVQEKEESERMIREVLKRSDIVFTVSEGLRERAKEFVPWSFLLPNGTNYHNFSRASLVNTEVPQEIIHLPKPIIGLVGFISSSLDFDLLTLAAQTKPNWSFVVIGPKLPAAAWGEHFFRLKNVYYLGPKAYFDLPKYMKAFDVCIIPYLRDDSLRMADSNKLYDYLATGKPIVVSQNTAGVGRFGDLIRISSSNHDFVIQIEESLKEDDPILVQKRQQTARENSWEKRGEEVWSKITEVLEGRESGRKNE